jgi:hypothetical protein
MSGMCCEQLVCGGCARPVAEARCSICRAARAELHHRADLNHHGVTVNVALLAVIVTAVLAAAAMVYGHVAG